MLFAGTPPENPAELLDSERMQAILEVVPDSYDLVVIDTPPALLSDAMPILDQVGGVVVVGRLGLQHRRVDDRACATSSSASTHRCWGWW